jgi:hypothetical protein
LKAVYDQSNSEFCDNECRKALHITFEGSWDITFRCIVKTLRREIAAALDLISLAAFKKLKILLGKLQSSRPFSGVGPVSVMSRGCISLPVTFGTAENFRTERVIFDVAKVSLPFNVILGRPALY